MIYFNSVGAAARAITQLKSNRFFQNKGGNPVFFHTMTLIDLTGNAMDENDDCDCCYGALIQREGERCIFLGNNPNGNIRPPPTSKPIESLPTIPIHNAPRGGPGYFNYDPKDNDYGPTAWNEVRNNHEYERYQELKQALQRPLLNKCNSLQSNQSPIDLCENIVNDDCKE